MKFNKISKKLAACSLAGVMMVSMLGMTAFAKTGATEAVTFEKTLDMSAAEGASVPDVAFPYLITPGDPVAATDNSPEILAGISGNCQLKRKQIITTRQEIAPGFSNRWISS